MSFQEGWERKRILTFVIIGIIGRDHSEDPVSYGTEFPEELDVIAEGGLRRVQLQILFSVSHCCIFSVSNKIIGDDVYEHLLRLCWGYLNTIVGTHHKTAHSAELSLDMGTQNLSLSVTILAWCRQMWPSSFCPGLYDKLWVPTEYCVFSWNKPWLRVPKTFHWALTH